jgi:hypothetical protein
VIKLEREVIEGVIRLEKEVLEGSDLIGEGGDRGE